MRDKIPGTNDWPGNQLRKERYIENIIDPTAERLDSSPINIYHIAYTLEGKERDSYRKEDVHLKPFSPGGHSKQFA